MAEEHDAAILRVKRFLSDCGLAVTWGEARGAVQAARASPPEPDALKLAEEALVDIQNNGLIYWEPRTARGVAERAKMLGRISDTLAAIRAAQARAAPDEEQAHG